MHDCVIIDCYVVFLQDCEAFNKGAFKIQIDFPAEYPFKPPKVTFKTKIYHPNIDEKGQVCLPIISAENWKPATKTDQGKSVLQITMCIITFSTMFALISNKPYVLTCCWNRLH